MPLIRRLPKRGFNNAAFHKNYAIVNLDNLNAFKAGSVVNEQVLRESNLIRGHFEGIKILGGGELKHGLTVEADKVSAAAREKIEKAGGTITLRERRARSEAVAPDDADLKAEQAPAETGRATTAKKKSATGAAGRAKSPKKKTSRKS